MNRVIQSAVVAICLVNTATTVLCAVAIHQAVETIEEIEKSHARAPGRSGCAN